MAGRLARAAQPLAAKARGSDFVRELRAAYDEGRAGADGASDGIGDGGNSDETGGGIGSDQNSDEAAVSEALQSVDWAAVRAATAEKSSEAALRMKAMAAEVDWAKVQAGAARVSSALIAAVASGQLPVGGRLAGPVARAIINEGGLAQRVHHSLRSSRDTQGADDTQGAQGADDTDDTDDIDSITTAEPPDFSGAIEAASRE